MPYFQKEHILFLHIPKTGGTSIEQYFSKKYDISLNEASLFSSNTEHTMKDSDQQTYIIPYSLQHYTYQDIHRFRQQLGVDMDDLHILATVRNPYERCISDLFFFQLIHPHTSPEQVYVVLQTFVQSQKRDNHNVPQHRFLDGLPPTAKLSLLHTETLTEDMHRLGFYDFQECANVNKKRVDDYYRYLNADSIELINRVYDRDFTLFGYDKLSVEEHRHKEATVIYKFILPFFLLFFFAGLIATHSFCTWVLPLTKMDCKTPTDLLRRMTP